MRLATVFGVAALAIVPAVAAAQDLDTGRPQTLEITIQATDVFTIANPGAIILSVPASNTATTFTNAGGNYTVATNAISTDTRNITAQITSGGATSGLTIEVNLSYSGNGTSAGFTPITASAVPVVTGIYASTHTGTISYRLTATAAVPATGGSPLAKTVTYTLIDAVP